MTRESLIGKQAILQVDEGECVPDEMWKSVQRGSYFFDEDFLSHFNLLKTGVTISNVYTRRYWNDNGTAILEKDYFNFEETKSVDFPAEFFQIAVKNHPLTTIFGD